MNHYNSETTGHYPAKPDTEPLISIEKPKRPKTHSKVRADDPHYTIYSYDGKKTGWLTRVYWDNRDNCWKAHTDRDEVMCGTDMVCYLDSKPDSPAKIIMISRVFARFCTGEVLVEN